MIHAQLSDGFIGIIEYVEMINSYSWRKVYTLVAKNNITLKKIEQKKKG